ncbi:MAG: hypothetical protein V1822_02520 [Candidatus Micrarchaeota archaeon]
MDMSGLEDMAAGAAMGAVAKEGLELAMKGGGGALRFGIDNVKALALQFKEGVDLSFVGKEDLQGYAQASKTPEYALVKRYIDSRKFRSIMLVGIKLKRMERNKEFDKINLTKQKVYGYSGKDGKRLAQFVQSGLFLRSWSILVGDSENDIDIRKKVNYIIEDLDKYVEFVETHSDSEAMSREIYTRIVANRPPLYMLGAIGDAIATAKKIVQNLKEKQIIDYDYDESITEGAYYVFIKRKEL